MEIEVKPISKYNYLLTLNYNYLLTLNKEEYIELIHVLDYVCYNIDNENNYKNYIFSLVEQLKYNFNKHMED